MPDAGDGAMPGAVVSDVRGHATTGALARTDEQCEQPVVAGLASQGLPIGNAIECARQPGRIVGHTCEEMLESRPLVDGPNGHRALG